MDVHGKRTGAALLHADLATASTGTPATDAVADQLAPGGYITDQVARVPRPCPDDLVHHLPPLLGEVQGGCDNDLSTAAVTTRRQHTSDDRTSLVCCTRTDDGTLPG